MPLPRFNQALGLACVLAGTIAAQNSGTPVGTFEIHGDLGATPKTGSMEYIPASNEYRVTGGGANIWGTEDAGYFAWKRLSGDITITADVHFVGTGAVEHRKAVLMVRQNLTPGSAYADVALHGVGLTSLQYRSAEGGATQEIQSRINAPLRIRIERRGNNFTMFVGSPGNELTSSGPVQVNLSDPVYVGIGVCSHDANVLETAVFANLTIEGTPPQQRYSSKIVIYDLAAKTNTTVYQQDSVIEAPNWSRDGKYLLVNTGGDLYRLPAMGAQPKLEKIDLHGDYRCNNDKAYSRNGKMLGFSATLAPSRASQVFVANADGSGARLLTPTSPSYFHGWSPEGKWMAFVGQRNGHFELFRVSPNGGEEQRLTSKGGYDDGPEYTPDGKWIYFNSNRSGSWDVWRIPADGGGPGDAKAQQVTSDEWEDWFPHISPNGKWMLVFAFPKGTATHNDRMDGVILRLMRDPGARLKLTPLTTLVTFFGGQGTINVNSWSPDSRKFAYVVYQPLR